MDRAPWSGRPAGYPWRLTGLARLSHVKRVCGAVVAAVLILSGCAAPTPEPVPSGAPSLTLSPTPEASALDALREAYAAAGGQCARITPRDTSLAEEAGDCDGGALLTTYGSREQRDGAISALEGLQLTNPNPHVIAVGPDWIVNGADAGSFAEAMGGWEVPIGDQAPPAPNLDLTTDAELCAADAELTNLELNDALAPLLGFPADRDARTTTQDDAIREYKNAAFLRECPARAG